MSNSVKLLSKSVDILLAERGITRSELARRLGVSRQTVGQYLNGKHAPGIDKIEAIANVLKVPVFYLLMPPEDREFWNVVTRGSERTLPGGLNLSDLQAEVYKKKKK